MIFAPYFVTGSMLYRLHEKKALCSGKKILEDSSTFLKNTRSSAGFGMLLYLILIRSNLEAIKNSSQLHTIHRLKMYSLRRLILNVFTTSSSAAISFRLLSKYVYPDGVYF